jgi:hypothetical protein
MLCRCKNNSTTQSARVSSMTARPHDTSLKSRSSFCSDQASRHLRRRPPHDCASRANFGRLPPWMFRSIRISPADCVDRVKSPGLLWMVVLDPSRPASRSSWAPPGAPGQLLQGGRDDLLRREAASRPTAATGR